MISFFIDLALFCIGVYCAVEIAKLSHPTAMLTAR